MFVTNSGQVYDFQKVQNENKSKEMISTFTSIINQEQDLVSEKLKKNNKKEKRMNIDIFLDEVNDRNEKEDQFKERSINYLQSISNKHQKNIEAMFEYNDEAGNSTLYVGNLNKNVNEEQLFLKFQIYGEISDLKIKRQEKSFKNIAFITFKIPLSAKLAKEELSDELFYGEKLKIGYINNNQDGEGRTIITQSNQARL